MSYGSSEPLVLGSPSQEEAKRSRLSTTATALLVGSAFAVGLVTGRTVETTGDHNAASQFNAVGSSHNAGGLFDENDNELFQQNGEGFRGPVQAGDYSWVMAQAADAFQAITSPDATGRMDRPNWTKMGEAYCAVAKMYCVYPPLCPLDPDGNPLDYCRPADIREKWQTFCNGDDNHAPGQGFPTREKACNEYSTNLAWQDGTLREGYTAPVIAE